MALHHSFSGKRVLITGGAQGIGRQLVERFHNDGAKVFAVDVNPEKIQELKKALPNVTAEVLDVTDWEATRKVVESFGVIDHLVNNAGINRAETFLDITKEKLTQQMDVNFASVVCVSQVVAKGLISAGKEGTIINLGSIAARRGNPIGLAVYAATKAAVENLTKSMAIELGAHNIRVNAVSPGMVDTTFVSGHDPTWSNDDYIETIKPRLVVKRIIKPDEIVDMIMFLSSPLSTMVVGECVLVDGGLLLS